ncbi:MAG: hypothetical protein OXU64_04740 [Gemmatimonadota bacterium]|nr:hypothetical protein [Gemmatimonadota bacterium]
MPLPTVLLRIQDEVARPYRQRIMANIYRSDYAEAIVAVALDRDGWTRMEAWSSWDFEHESGCRLEVKQAAAAQSWGSSQEEKAARFDIKARKDYWDPAAERRMPAAGRVAHVYVFGWHGAPEDRADHRDPESWEWYVVPAARLPDGQKSIGLGPIRRMVSACTFGELSTTVGAICRTVMGTPQSTYGSG